MKKRKRASASTLFLMELIIAIMFFALAATVCIAVFVRAHIQSRDARQLNMACNITGDAAEIIRSQTTVSGTRSIFLRSYPNATITGPDSGCDIKIYFDEDFKEIDENHAVYTESIHLSLTDAMLTVTISFADKSGEEIYSLDMTHDFLQRGSL